MFRRTNKNVNILVLIFGIAIIGSLIFTIISTNKQKNKLQVYDGEEQIEEIATTEKEIVIETNTYIDEDNIFSVQIPVDWELVKNNDYIEFVHKPSATSVQLIKEPYDPNVTVLNASDISANVVNAGYTFVSCDYMGNASSETIYQKVGDNTYDYIEEVFWCRDYIVTLKFILNDANYSKMSPYLDKIYNSFTWSEDMVTVPEGYYLVYLDYGDFEFLVPEDWTLGTEENSVVSSNQDNTAQMVVKDFEYNDDLSQITTYELSDLIKPGRENGFMITNSSSSVNKAYAECAYYNSNGINMVNKTYLFVNGYYMYSIQFDYVANSIDENIPALCSQYFREFITKKLQEEMEYNSLNVSPDAAISSPTDSE